MIIILPVDEDKEKICVSFARAPFFMVVNTESMSKEVVDNEAAAASGGAGIQAAQIVMRLGADAIIVPRCGENAAKVLNEAEIKIYKSETNSSKDEIEKFVAGKLKILKEIHAGFQHSDFK